MTDTFHILNNDGLEYLQDHLNKNQKAYVQLPKHLIKDSQYYEDSKIEFDISHMQGMDLWEVGKELIPILDNEPYFHNADFIKLWSSLSLYFADLILPETYNGERRKQLEGRRYAIETGRSRYKHLIYSAYLCNKTWGDKAKFLLPQNFTNVQYDKFLGSASLYRYNNLFDIIKKLYIDTNASLGSKKEGSFNEFMKFILQFAVNNSLSVIDTEEFYDKIPNIFKQHGQKIK